MKKSKNACQVGINMSASFGREHRCHTHIKAGWRCTKSPLVLNHR